VTYRSPFSHIGSDHNGPDALCLSRTHCTDAVEDTLAEFHGATLAAIERRAPQPAFFLARQLAELGLKALHGPNPPRGHDLLKLLESLAERGDDLLDGGDDQLLIVEFIRDLDRCDSNGDEGRYPRAASGQLSLATVCCADPTLLLEHVNRLYGYVRRRMFFPADASVGATTSTAAAMTWFAEDTRP
jgi:HEPN domain-containing protein